MTSAWFWGIIGALLIALISFFAKKGYDAMKKHKEEHEFLEEIRAGLNQHQVDHDKINDSLTHITKANMLQLKDRIVQKYMNLKDESHIGLYDKEVFKEMCATYYNLGGNGFIHTIEAEIDQKEVR